MKKFLIVLGALSVAGASAFAGDLAESITVVTQADNNLSTGTANAPGWFIPAVILGALIGVALLADNDSKDDKEEEEAPAEETEEPVEEVEETNGSPT